MRRGVRRPAAAVRLAVVFAMPRTAWLASLMAAAIGAYVVSSGTEAAGQLAAWHGSPFHGTPAVGALFTSSNGKLGPHFCTATVVTSPAGNLLITAPHSLEGPSPSPAAPVTFAPAYPHAT